MNLIEGKVIQLFESFFEEKEVEVYIRLPEAIYYKDTPYFIGNKYWKMKYNLLQARQENQQALLTFGGAYSNHIYATALLGKIENFRTIGIIRGEEVLPLNSTLQFAKNMGMQLHYMDRSTYRKKHTEGVQNELRSKWKDFYLIPEGGSNHLAVKGTQEWGKCLDSRYHYVCTPCGTGATAAGLCLGIGNQNLIVFSALKGGQFLSTDIQNFISEVSPEKNSEAFHFDLRLDCHFGGFAKTKPELLSFLKNFTKKHRILLEHVYTGKMIWGIYQLIRNNYFKRKSKILLLHTGGLQNTCETN